MNKTYIDHLADRFCGAPVPDSECADPCATMHGYPNRTGTNFLSIAGAKAVLEHVLGSFYRLSVSDEKGITLRLNEADAMHLLEVTYGKDRLPSLKAQMAGGSAFSITTPSLKGAIWLDGADLTPDAQ